MSTLKVSLRLTINGGTCAFSADKGHCRGVRLLLEQVEIRYYMKYIKQDELEATLDISRQRDLNALTTSGCLC
jgi:hypothetical protein